jgi:hypothetical protein
VFACELNCINCNPVPHGTRNPPHEGALNSGLTSADSRLQLDLEIALSGVSAKIQPCGLFSRAEDKLKLSDDVILLDAPFIRKYGARQQQI